jgi:hypothetical protein
MKKLKERPGKMTTKVGRLSFPYLLAPRPGKKPEDDRKWEATILLKKETVDISPFRDIATQIAVEAFDVESLDDLKNPPIKDGDKGKQKKIDGWPGHNAISAKCREDRPPMLFTRDKRLLKVGKDDEEIRELFYAGAQVQMSVCPYVYETDENHGVGWRLLGVRFIRHDTPFTMTAGADDFGDDDIGEDPVDDVDSGEDY